MDPFFLMIYERLLDLISWGLNLDLGGYGTGIYNEWLSYQKGDYISLCCLYHAVKPITSVMFTLENVLYQPFLPKFGMVHCWVYNMDFESQNELQARGFHQ